jgi:hypothetical protein
MTKKRIVKKTAKAKAKRKATKNTRTAKNTKNMKDQTNDLDVVIDPSKVGDDDITEKKIGTKLVDSGPICPPVVG